MIIVYNGLELLSLTVYQCVSLNDVLDYVFVMQYLLLFCCNVLQYVITIFYAIMFDLREEECVTSYVITLMIYEL